MSDEIRWTCERCGRRMRQVIQIPGSEIVQDWYAPWPPKPGDRALHVSEIDPDMCEDCGEEFIEECRKYHGDTTEGESP
jgi:hypothetical protein